MKLTITTDEAAMLLSRLYRSPLEAPVAVEILRDVPRVCCADTIANLRNFVLAKRADAIKYLREEFRKQGVILSLDTAVAICELLPQLNHPTPTPPPPAQVGV